MYLIIICESLLPTICKKKIMDISVISKLNRPVSVICDFSVKMPKTSVIKFQIFEECVRNLENI